MPAASEVGTGQIFLTLKTSYGFAGSGSRNLVASLLIECKESAFIVQFVHNFVPNRDTETIPVHSGTFILSPSLSPMSGAIDFLPIRIPVNLSFQL
ncbi:hypothetical protein AVEN_248094-1 [Araneus ventricosus]|uniref:Uncharacterized protein n=1 Tax=Araneus ventricosus TaxID=182803 RepID=A0A4Y2T9W4_ARAVE|nr:hypothetical protein AVEN_124327-1 [Araneus ventricosus]GBN96276.1 hypothetical protein AVEN_248094-1 [Araneus ventricosus]